MSSRNRDAVGHTGTTAWVSGRPDSLQRLRGMHGLRVHAVEKAAWVARGHRLELSLVQELLQAALLQGFRC